MPYFFKLHSFLGIFPGRSPSVSKRSTNLIILTGIVEQARSHAARSQSFLSVSLPQPSLNLSTGTWRQCLVLFMVKVCILISVKVGDGSVLPTCAHMCKSDITIAPSRGPGWGGAHLSKLSPKSSSPSSSSSGGAPPSLPNNTSVSSSNAG